MQQQSFHPGKTNPPVEVYPLQNQMRHSGEEMTTRGLGQKTNEALQRRLFRHHPLGGPIYRVNTERCKTTQAMTVVRMNKRANGQTLLAKTGNLFHHSTLYNGGIKSVMYNLVSWCFKPQKGRTVTTQKIILCFKFVVLSFVKSCSRSLLTQEDQVKLIHPFPSRLPLFSFRSLTPNTRWCQMSAVKLEH